MRWVRTRVDPFHYSSLLKKFKTIVIFLHLPTVMTAIILRTLQFHPAPRKLAMSLRHFHLYQTFTSLWFMTPPCLAHSPNYAETSPCSIQPRLHLRRARFMPLRHTSHHIYAVRMKEESSITIKTPTRIVRCHKISILVHHPSTTPSHKALCIHRMISVVDIQHTPPIPIPNIRISKLCGSPTLLPTKWQTSPCPGSVQMSLFIHFNMLNALQSLQERIFWEVPHHLVSPTSSYSIRFTEWNVQIVLVLY